MEEMDAKQAGEGEKELKRKDEMGKRILPPAAAATLPENPARNATWRMQGRGSTARWQR